MNKCISILGIALCAGGFLGQNLRAQSPWHISASANLNSYTFDLVENRNVHSIMAYDKESGSDVSLLDSRNLRDQSNFFGGIGARIGGSYQWKP